MKSLFQGHGRQGWGRSGQVGRAWVRLLLCLGLAGSGVLNGAEVMPVPISRDYAVRIWRKVHGLPDSRVTCLLLARDGFLWAGTRAGLVRFDGHRFSVWRRATHASFTHDACRALAEGPDGRIWAATDRGVVVLGEEEPAQPPLHRGPGRDAESDSDLRPEFVAGHALLTLRHGPVLVGSDQGVWMHGPPEVWPAPALRDERLRSAVVWRLVQTPDQALWVGLTDQLYRLASGSTNWEAQLPAASRAAHGVHALAVDTAGVPHAILGHWEQRRGWLHRLTAGGWQRVLEAELSNGQQPLLLAPSGLGGLWFTLGPRRLGWWRAGELRVYALEGLWEEDDRMLSLLEDGDQNLWIGLAQGGLYCLLRRRVELLTPREGLPHPNTRALFESRDGAFWVGTDQGVARFLDGQVQVPGGAAGRVPLEVRALAEDGEGRVWIGTAAGLCLWDPSRPEPVPLDGPWSRTSIRCLLRDRHGALWVGTARGMHRLLQGARRSWSPENGLPHEDVRVITETRAGEIWIGTDGGGLARVREDGFDRFDEAHGLSSPRVWALLEDGAGWLWAGTDRGLNCLHQGRITPLTTAHGLPDNLVNSLVLDVEGWLWIGHDAGIYRVRRDELAAVVQGQQTRVRAIGYHEDDGLPQLETNGQISHPAALRRRDDRIAFATVAGVALFDPYRPPDVTNGPPARITRVEVGNRVVYAGGPGALPGPPKGPPLRVRPGDPRFLKIEFAAPQFRTAEKTCFRYRLRGVDPDWMEAGHDAPATYAHLPPGAYTFEVQAANSHGYWGGHVARLDFEIVPHLLERPEVRLSLVGLLVAGGVGLGWLRLQELRRLQRLQFTERLVEERTRLTRDLHERLGASLSVIHALSHQLADLAAAQPYAPHLQQLAATSHAALETLRELIWTNNPAADHLRDLLDRLQRLVVELTESAGLRARFTLPSAVADHPVGPEFRRQVLLAAREAVNNVLRHAQAREVALQVALEGGRLVVEIADDGVGFDPQKPTPLARVAPGQGLDSMRALIEGLGGTFHLDTAPGRGTRVVFRLPLPVVAT